MMETICHWRAKLESRASQSHAQIPGLRKLPLPALGIILLLVFVNMLTWAAVGVVLVWLSMCVDGVSKIR